MTRAEITERLIIEWRIEKVVGMEDAVRRYRPELATLLDALIDTDAAADTACTCPCRGECTT